MNVATRTTDLDTKNVKVFSDNPAKSDASFLLTLKNRNWMKQNAFAVFLNKMGHTRTKYGGVLAKKVERDGELEIYIPQWRNMITDQVDIAFGVKIERHYYTPADLKTKAPKNWSNIDDAIEAAKKSQEANAGSSPSKKNKTPGSYIEVYEVHGVLPTSYLAGTSEKYAADYGSEKEFERQMHVVVLDESDKENTTGTTLYAGIEDEDSYKYLAYEEVEGRGLGVGVVEDLFEALVWTNYSVKQKKDVLDLAGKIIFQTSDTSVAAKNVLTDLENGTILTTAMNQPVTQVNNVPAGLGGLSQLMSDWNEQAENATSTYPAVLGQSPTSGTAFRLQATLVSQASTLFDYRRQEAGLFVQEIYHDWVLPFLVRQMKSAKEIVADLDPEELQWLSDKVAEHHALQFAKQQVLAGDEPVHPQDLEAIRSAARQHVTGKGNRHAFDEFKGILDGWEGSVDVDTVGEQRDTQAALSTLFQLLNPNVAMLIQQNPTMAKTYNELIETAGLPLTLQQHGTMQAQQQSAPTQDQIAQPTTETLNVRPNLAA